MQPSSIFSTFIHNLQRPELSQCPPTQFDQELAVAANFFFCRRAELDSGTFAPRGLSHLYGEPEREELIEMMDKSKQEVYKLAELRNTDLKIKKACEAYLISTSDLDKVFNITNHLSFIDILTQT